MSIAWQWTEILFEDNWAGNSYRIWVPFSEDSTLFFGSLYVSTLSIFKGFYICTSAVNLYMILRIQVIMESTSQLNFPTILDQIVT